MNKKKDKDEISIEDAMAELIYETEAESVYANEPQEDTKKGSNNEWKVIVKNLEKACNFTYVSIPRTKRVG